MQLTIFFEVALNVCRTSSVTHLHAHMLIRETLIHTWSLEGSINIRAHTLVHRHRHALNKHQHNTHDAYIGLPYRSRVCTLTEVGLPLVTGCLSATMKNTNTP